ncbi:MAG TPA: Uma2 family endonuclease [Bryobacteraceae bacterium]|nr:Uma2 family endonuclease [Bryobacteraceae bacterium]
MATVPNTRTVTYEEWLRMPEVSDAIEEVVNGEIRIMPPPKWVHTRIVVNLNLAITAQVDAREVIVVPAQFGLIIRRVPLTSRVPDLAVFRTSTIEEEDGYIHSAPQLVVEVISPANTRPRIEEKVADYASLGVHEAWLFWPEARTVEVLYLEEGRMRIVQVLREGILTPKHFPQVKVEIAAIWPE